jgi:hypothetical protein
VQMSPHSGFRRIVRWGLSAALVLGGLYAFNGAAFHWWASSGPPTAIPEWHRAWSFRFALVGLVCFLLAGVTVWSFRARSKRSE